VLDDGLMAAEISKQVLLQGEVFAAVSAGKGLGVGLELLSTLA
jgi:hypothetical protein